MQPARARCSHLDDRHEKCYCVSLTVSPLLASPGPHRSLTLPVRSMPAGPAPARLKATLARNAGGEGEGCFSPNYTLCPKRIEPLDLPVRDQAWCSYGGRGYPPSRIKNECGV